MKETCSVLGFVVLSVSRCYSNADVKVKLRQRCLFAWQDRLNVPFDEEVDRQGPGAPHDT